MKKIYLTLFIVFSTLVNVFSQNACSLSLAPGSDSDTIQIACPNNPNFHIIYDVGGDTVFVEGLPEFEGFDVVYSNNQLSITAHRFAIGASYEYTVTATGGCTKDTMAFGLIMVPSPPDAEIITSDVTVCDTDPDPRIAFKGYSNYSDSYTFSYIINRDFGDRKAAYSSSSEDTVSIPHPISTFGPGVWTYHLTQVDIGQCATELFDSVVIVVNDDSLGMRITDTVNSCTPYTWIDGITYTESNYSATHILNNVSGCDTVVSLNLTLKNTTRTDTVTACDSYTWRDGITYTASNSTATYMEANPIVCSDTTYTTYVLDLTIEDCQIKLWGMTSEGGNTGLNHGTIFETHVNNKTLTTKGTFFNYEGRHPTGYCTEASNGKLYGTAVIEGEFGDGVLYEYDPSTDTYTKKYDFDELTSGDDPNGSLVEASNGKLYGMTTFGGANRAGVLYEFDITTGAYIILLNFEGDWSATGGFPYGGLLEASNGKLYGVTSQGGTYNGGVLFEYDLSTSTFINKFNFEASITGNSPRSAMIQLNNGKLYGTAHGGGDYGAGVIFEYDIVLDTLINKFSFNDTIGNSLNGSLLEASNGLLYGIASNGGVSPNGNGTLYEFDPATNICTAKFNFDGTNMGSEPSGSMVETSNGNLLGMTLYGGASDDGVLFKYNPVSDTIIKILDFNDKVSGRLPQGALTLSSNGKLYGSTRGGGVNSWGIFFEFDHLSETFSKKFDFEGRFALNGRHPTGSLLQANNHILYGYTPTQGGVFSFVPTTNTFTHLQYFSIAIQGTTHNGSLMQASNGNLYGMIRKGGGAGSDDTGILYEYNIATNLISRKIDFDAATIGANPEGSLIEAVVGKLYGLTSKGGASDNGVLFEYELSTDTYTKKVEFDGTAKGSSPMGSLMKTNNGMLYGVTKLGGANDFGVLFEYDPLNDIYTKKLDFDGANNGAYPYDSLVQTKNGKLYGMTSEGGSANFGVLFEYDPSTNIYTKKIDFNGINGQNPMGALMQASNDRLYGMTKLGGANDDGVIFEYIPSTETYTKIIDFDSINGQHPFGNLIELEDCEDESIDSLATCDSIIWIDGNTYKENNNTATYTLTNQVGCDSVVTLNLTIAHLEVDEITACDSITWIDGITYTENNNSATYTLLNSTGCDTIVGLDLTIISATTGVDSITACNSYTWIDGVTYTSSNNTAQFTLTNALGCDSLISLDLTIVTEYCDLELWGMTTRGGLNDQGVMFSYHVATNLYTIKTDFSNLDVYARAPAGSLMQASNDSLYGYTKDAKLLAYDPVTESAQADVGVSVGTLGSTLEGAMIQMNNRNLIGSSKNGGAYDDGVLFEYNITTDSITEVFDFNDTLGRQPCDVLVETVDGIFYGTTIYGGEFGEGTLFKYDLINDVFTKKVDFGESKFGSYPKSLLLASNGKFYGMVGGFNPFTKQSLFEYDPILDTCIVKYTSTDVAEGKKPSGHLVEASNGKLYGMMESGGAYGGGTLFEFDIATEAYSNKIDLDIENGSGPLGALMQGSNGKLYGMTYGGGASDMGVLFEFDIDTDTYTKKLDFDGTNGKWPRQCQLIEVNACYNSAVDNITACDSITWIDGITYIGSNNTARHILTNVAGCDSVVTLNLTITDALTGVDTITSCDSITWIDGITYTASNNTATDTLTSASGCDSIITLDLTITTDVTATDVITSCDSITWIDGVTYTASNNTATHTLTSAVGCDSIVTLDFTITSTLTATDVITSCDSITWIDGNTYTANNNTATHTLTSTSGCDSIVTLDLTINSVATTTDIIVSCDPVTWIDGATYITSNNTATYTLTSINGCDSIVTLDLTITNSTTGVDVITSCDSVTWIDGITYTASNNSATHTLPNSSGCDSVVTLDLTVANSNAGIDVIASCDSVTWIDGITYTVSNNTATHTLTNIAGCDSIVTLDLTITNSTTGVDVITSCDSIEWIDGITYTSSNTTATHTLTNIAGCDSVITLNLTVTDSITGIDVISSCDSITWIDGITYSVSNSTATHTLVNANGCDSVVTLNLTVDTAYYRVDKIVACDSFVWIDGITYTTSNNSASDTISGGAACDSIFYLDLTINNANTGVDVITSCNSLTWIDGITYTANNNTATHTLSNVSGCDSVVTLNLTITNSNTGVDVITSCDSTVWIDGITYTSNNNTATYTLINVSGCDSVVTLDLTINTSSSSTDTQVACGSYTWVDGNTYTASNNTATDTLTSATGCDSVITLDLTINNSSSTTDTQTACGSYTWIDGNTYTTSNNTVTHTLNNVSGCDSVITLDLTITPALTSTDIITSCDPVVWIDGNTYATSNNTARDTLMSSTGCDSIIRLNLTINTVNTVTTTDESTITATELGASYRWLDCNNNAPISNETARKYTATSSGNYAVEVTKGGCVDTSSCENLTVDCYVHYTTEYDSLSNTFILNVDSITASFADSYVWDFGDGNSSTQPNPTHQYDQDGLYNVCLTIFTIDQERCTYCNVIGKGANGEIFRLSGFTINIINPYFTIDSLTSLSFTPLEKNNFEIYPNPTDGKVFIAFDDEVNDVIIKVLNATGKRMEDEKKFSGRRFEIDLTRYSNGVFIIEVIQNGEIDRAKVIKQ